MYQQNIFCYSCTLFSHPAHQYDRNTSRVKGDCAGLAGERERLGDSLGGGGGGSVGGSERAGSVEAWPPLSSP